MRLYRLVDVFRNTSNVMASLQHNMDQAGVEDPRLPSWLYFLNKGDIMAAIRQNYVDNICFNFRFEF